MQWAILVIPVPILFLLFIILCVVLIACVLWYLWIRSQHKASPCCVCGSAHGHEVSYRDESGRPVEEHFCSVCLGKLICPVEDR